MGRLGVAIKPGLRRILTTTGDVLHRDATDVDRLPIGADKEIAQVETNLLGYDFAIEPSTINATDGTDATSPTAAAVKTAGGLAVAKKVYATGPSFIGIDARYRTNLQVQVDPIADNVATTLLTFVVPNPDVSAIFSTIVGAWVTFTFHTNVDAANYMTSSVSFYVSLLRNRNQNTQTAIDFLSTVVSHEVGTAATHAGLAVGQFSFAITGAAGVGQTVELQFTNNYDAGVTAARVDISLALDVLATLAADVITVS